MSPSLDSSDSHSCSGLSNTSSSSEDERPQQSSDALPMFNTSNFVFADDASGQGLSSSPFRAPSMCASPQPMTQWAKLSIPLARSVAPERQGGLTASLTPTGMGSFSNKLTVPVPAYGRVGSPFDLSTSDCSGQNELVDARPSLNAAFLLTRSRAVKVRKLPGASFMSLRSIFEFLGETNQADSSGVGTSLSVWTLKDLSAPDEAWVVFKSHHDAYIFLSLSLPSFTILPALEADLEPFEKLRRVDVFSRLPPLPLIQPERKSHRLRMSISTPDFHSRIHVGHPGIETPNSSITQAENFVISSNPPNPRTTFRVGDWICNSVTCSAHNFGRNLTCRGCGCPRSESQASSMNINRQALGMHSTRLPSSPRFANGSLPFYAGSPIPNSPCTAVQHGARYPLATQAAPNCKSVSPSHPLLTPSGRSFSVGGKVQNVSNDPTIPCIMYWPDNEPFPEQGQIRPSNLAGVPQPPILNTGNRGPIEHQPGDWICQKCNYLNWRRRKVCQTCYPYAEGNGDSISAAVQSERINLLTSLLAQNQLPLRTTPPTLDAPRRSTIAQMSQQRPPETIATSSRPSRSQINLRAAAQCPDPQFIYETSGPHRYGSPSFPGMRELGEALPVSAPVPLLPSFLQDIVQSPTLSPTSSSSADLSIEEYEDVSPSPRAGREQVVARDEPTNYPIGNIWRLNDEETTNIPGIALPHHEDLVGCRKQSGTFSSPISVQ